MKSRVHSAWALCDPLSKIFLAPWMFWHLQLYANLSLSRAITIYGFILSFIAIGHICGGGMYSSLKRFPPTKIAEWFCSILSITFLLLGISSNISMILLCSLSIGICAAVLRSASKSASGDAGSRVVNAAGPVSDDYTRLAGGTYIFCPLLCGLMYDPTMTRQCPAMMLCVSVALFFAVLAALSSGNTFCCRKRNSGKLLSSMGGGTSQTQFTPQTERKSTVAVPAAENLVPPQTFIDMCRGDKGAAQRKYWETLKWRADHSVDDILDIPQESFHDIMRYYPHALQGRTRSGAVVCYEQLGKGNAKELKARGISPESLLWHFVLRNEFIFKRCRKNFRDGDPVAERSAEENGQEGEPATRIMTVLDVKGISFSDMSTDVVKFIQMSAEVMDSHFPGCVERLVLCNTPGWFFSVWNVVARVLPESVKKKIVTINSLSKLDEYIDPAMRPSEYAGTGCDLRESHDHKALLAVAEQWKEQNIVGRQLAGPGDGENPDCGEKLQHSSKSDESKGWMWGWWNGSSKSNSKPQAYLGESNRYRYDAETGEWILDNADDGCDECVTFSSNSSRSGDSDEDTETGNDSDSDNQEFLSRSGRMTVDQIEEHGLVLAIQAAHHAAMIRQQQLLGKAIDTRSASTMSSNINSSSKDSSLPLTGGSSNYFKDGRGKRLMSRERHSRESAGNLSMGTGNSLMGEPDDEVDVPTQPLEKPSAELFLMAIGMHLVCCMLFGTISTLLPMWMIIPSSKGGLGYEIKDSAVVLSMAGVVGMILSASEGHRAKLSLRAFPVRTLRVAVGALAFFCYCLVFYAHIDRSSAFNVSTRNHFSDLVMWCWYSLIGSHGSSDEKHSNFFPTPSSNPLTVLVPGFLVGVILCTSYMSCQASALILKHSLASVLTSPAKVERCLWAIAAVLTPFGASSFFLWTHRLRQENVTDDALFLSVVACAALFVYICSLMISVRFRGSLES